jgi:DNA-binding winged helix-turn-helix (wHTH) protein
VKVRFGEYAFDPETRRLTRGDTELHLTPKAFDLLAVLVERAPRVVTKAELHQLLWPRTFVSDSSLVALVKELRRVMTHEGGQAPVRTATRVGYALGLDVQRRDGPLAFTGHYLVVADRRVPLHAGENILGRHEEADVRLEGSTVSRRHARVVVDGDRASIEDMASTNGTRVDGQPVSSSPVALRNGAEILIGSVPVLYLASLSDMSTETQVTRDGSPGEPGL